MPKIPGDGIPYMALLWHKNTNLLTIFNLCGVVRRLFFLSTADDLSDKLHIVTHAQFSIGATFLSTDSFDTSVEDLRDCGCGNTFHYQINHIAFAFG